MFTHVVFFKLKDKKDIQKTRDLLLALKDKISLIKFIEVGVNIIESDRAYDLILYTKFESIDDMKAYQVHPEHVKFGEYLNGVKESTVSVDYE